MGNITLSMKSDGIYAEYDEPAGKLLFIATNISLNRVAEEQFKNISIRSTNQVEGYGFGSTDALLNQAEKA